MKKVVKQIMDKIKRYIDCYIPTESCNLRCHYCYIAQKRKFNNKILKLKRTYSDIKKAFSQERLGGVCLINLCAGGETLLSRDVLPIAKALIEEGHYVMIVSNGTISDRFKEISQWDERLKSHLVIKFSFHYLELVRLNILDRYFSNIKLMKENNVSLTVELTPSDELIGYIDEIKEVCLTELDTLCHVTIARDDRTNGINHLSKYDFQKYKEIWSTFDSKMFEFKSNIFYQKRNEFCYAGDWSLYINIDSGTIRQCYCGKLLGNIYNYDEPIKFEAVGARCILPHCYNGHSFLTLGDIPEITGTSYADVRNRKCSDGTEWLTPNVKYIMQSRLSESNKQYSFYRKFRINHQADSFREFMSTFEFYQKLHDIKIKNKH